MLQMTSRLSIAVVFLLVAVASAAPNQTELSNQTVLPDGVYAFKVFLNKPQSWSSVVHDLNGAFCTSSSSYCYGVTNGKFWLPEKEKEDGNSYSEYLVAVNVSWMMYAVEGTPVEAIGTAGEYNRTEVIKPDVFPPVDQRGANQVVFYTQASSKMYSFADLRTDVVNKLDDISQDDMTLANMSCTMTAGNAFPINCTFIVSFTRISSQVESAAIPWTSYRFDSTPILNATLFPNDGVDLDDTTTRYLGNRVFFSFSYDTYYSYTTYGYLLRNSINDSFTSNMNVDPKDVVVQKDEATLVKATITTDDDKHRYYENFTVSFATPNQASKIVNLFKDGNEYTSSSMKFAAVLTAASPSLVTPDPWTRPEDDGDLPVKESNLLLSAGIVLGVVVLFIIVGIVLAKTQSSAGPKHGDDDDVAMNSNDHV